MSSPPRPAAATAVPDAPSTAMPGSASSVGALRLALIYASVSALWVFFSDAALERWITDPGRMALAGAIKGWAFTAVTAALLYGLLRRRGPPLTPVATEAAPLSRRRLLRRVLVAVAAVAAVTALGVYYTVERDKRIELDRLHAVAELKVQQVRAWLDERARDALLLADGVDTQRLLRRWREQGDLRARDEWLARLQRLGPLSGFSAFSLLDENGALLWRSPGSAAAHDRAALAALQQAQPQARVWRQGPRRDDQGHVHTYYAVRLVEDGAPPGHKSALLLCQLDESAFLPAGFNDWPVPSVSGEVVLARREGDQVVFLNALRWAPDAALQMRLPLADGGLMMAKLFQQGAGKVQVVQGKDYRGEPSFGVGHQVPGTDWVLLARVDAGEVHAAAVKEALWIVLAGALGVFIALAALTLARQRQQLAWVAQTQQAQADRLRALQLLGAIAEGSDDAIFAKDKEGRYTLFNAAAAAHLNRQPESVLGRDDRALFPAEEARGVMATDARVMSLRQNMTLEERLTTAHGERVFLVIKGPLRDAGGAVSGIFGISRDITALKQAEDGLRRANRALLTSRECGQALVHAESEDELLQAVTRIVVHTGGYRMAWVGLAENDDQRSVRPVAIAGNDDGYAQGLQLSWADDERGRGPTGRAIREQRPIFCRDIANDPDFTLWRAAALARGYRSSISLPLLQQDRLCLGALTLYAATPDAFDEEEIRLASQLAADMAFGIRTLRDRAARRSAEALVREERRRLTESQRLAAIGSWQIEGPALRLIWSAETYRLHGVDPAQFVLDLAAVDAQIHPEDRAAHQAWRQGLLDGQAMADSEFRVALPGGGWRHLNARGRLEQARAGRSWRVVGTVQDVTAQRQAEAERLTQEARYRELFAANPHPMWVVHRETLAFLEVNQAAVTKYGYSREEFLAMTVADIRPREDLPRLLHLLGSSEAGRDENQVWRHRLKDGSVILVKVSARNLSFGGQPAVVALANDVTAQQHAEAVLALQAGRAEALLRLPGWAERLDESAFMQQVLALAEDLTGSGMSFMHFVDMAAGRIEMAAWSTRTLASHGGVSHERYYPLGEAGVWADACRLRQPVCVNDGAAYPGQRDLPGDHPALRRLIALPVLDNGEVVLLAGLGGRDSDYTEFEIETLQLLGNDTWRLVQRRRTDAALAQSEQRYRNLTEQVPVIIYRAHLDPRDGSTYISPAVQSLGYSAQEWLAQPGLWWDSLHPGDRERVLAGAAAARRDGGGFDLEYRLRARDGAWRHLHDKAQLARDTQGQPLGWQGVMIDVTARVQAESELRKLQLAVEQSPNSIVITNLRAEIEYVNAAFVHTTGYSRDELMGRNPRILHGDKVRPGDHQDLWATLTAGRPWRGVFHNKRKDGSTYLEIAHLAPVRQADGQITHYVGVKEDITEKTRIGDELDHYRLRLEELVVARTTELAEARSRAEAASRAKSAFLANMSHEIRTPMNAIVGLSFLLQRDQATPRQAERLGKIDAAALQLLSIINGILDLSKIEAGKLVLEYTDFELGQLLRLVQGLIADRAQAKGVQVSVDAGPLPCWLYGDMTRLSQALSNYADNALKFTEHGSITLRSQVLEEDAEGLLMRFEVQDTGIGIAADDLPRLFQAFEQADASTTRQYGGTGLGLALARRLAGLMGGQAGAVSQPGVGSSFWLTARLSRGRAAAPAATLAASDVAANDLRQLCAGARVLLAEDEAVNREVAIELLHAAGLVVDTAVDGRQAVRHALAQSYDLVLMDVQMPLMDGFDATRALRAEPRLAALPILALTANAFEEDRRACLAAGMNDFVPKPVDPPQLYATLLRWLPQRGGPRSSTAPGPLAAADHGLDPSEQALLMAALGRIHGLDARRALVAMQGKLRAYLPLLLSLVAQHGDDPQRLTAQLAAQDYADAQATAHRLRGAAGALGADLVQDAAAALEEALRRHDAPARLQRLCEDLCLHSASLFQALRELPTLRTPVPAAEADPVQTYRVLSELEPLLASDDAAANEHFDAHRGLLTATLGAVAATLGHQIESFDFPAALATLRQALAANDGKTRPG